jgi:hypothetical protein
MKKQNSANVAGVECLVPAGGRVVEPRHSANFVPCPKNVVTLNPFEGFAVMDVDDKGVESFAYLIDDADNSDILADAKRHAESGMRVYEIAAIVLSGREIPGTATPNPTKHKTATKRR